MSGVQFLSHEEVCELTGARTKAGQIPEPQKERHQAHHQNERVAMLRRRFDIAREAAGVAKPQFQMRDLRAKAGTDKAESSGDIMQAKDQLGHTTVVMTEQ